MTEAHKAALADGRRSGAIVRRYLAALEDGYCPAPDDRLQDHLNSTKALLETTAAALARELDPVNRMVLDSKCEKLTQRRDWLEEQAQGRSLEDKFVSVAWEYGRRKRITYNGWRSAGVPARVLHRAGIRDSGGGSLRP
jgi:hypothetical protein